MNLDKYKTIMDNFLTAVASLPQKVLGVFDVCITTINTYISSPKKAIMVLLGAWISFELIFRGTSTVITYAVDTVGKILAIGNSANFQTIALLVVVIVGINQMKKNG
jgi:hypothetical protein